MFSVHNFGRQVQSARGRDNILRMSSDLFNTYHCGVIPRASTPLKKSTIRKKRQHPGIHTTQVTLSWSQTKVSLQTLLSSGFKEGEPMGSHLNVQRTKCLAASKKEDIPSRIVICKETEMEN